MSDIAQSPPEPVRQLTLTATIGIALATFIIGLLIAGLVVWRMVPAQPAPEPQAAVPATKVIVAPPRSEEHTSELQSH